jgi:D-alanyl-D-alanine carboxypeptidase/D-alanyl-D-alanine-endopeptidase (penicillin-binding protein 4)
MARTATPAVPPAHTATLSRVRRRPVTLIALLAVLAFPAGALGQSSADRALERALTKTMRGAGPNSGAYVLNTADRSTLFKWKPDTPRVLASNTKLFTAAVALDQLGPEETLHTLVLGDGQQLDDGTWQGDLYLRGGGDPTFGSASFTKRSYREGATVEELGDAIEGAGIARVTGRVYGDESRFDSLRGGPDSGFRTSIWVGPLSALSYNRGFASERGTAYQSNPPAFAAAQLDAVLEKRGIAVRGAPASGVAPADLTELARVDSPPVSELVRLMLKPSDNFFAEMLIKQVGATPGTTRGGTRAAVAHAASLDSRVRLGDGSGLWPGDKASPRSVGRLLDAMTTRSDWDAFQKALPIAGKDGTLKDRMRSGPARGRCRAKTGTITGVSTLSGYCRSRGGDTLVFSFLMNGVSVTGARALQDRMAQALAAYDG